MAESNDAIFLFASVIRGHHIYKALWTPLLGEHLGVFPEEGNGHDLHAVSVMKEGVIVGHVPKEHSRTFHFFISHGGTVSYEVTGHRRLGFGLEVQCIYKLTGKEKMIMKAKEILSKKKNKRSTTS